MLIDTERGKVAIRLPSSLFLSLSRHLILYEKKEWRLRGVWSVNCWSLGNRRRRVESAACSIDITSGRRFTVSLVTSCNNNMDISWWW